MDSVHGLLEDHIFFVDDIASFRRRRVGVLSVEQSGLSARVSDSVMSLERGTLFAARKALEKQPAQQLSSPLLLTVCDSKVVEVLEQLMVSIVVVLQNGGDGDDPPHCGLIEQFVVNIQHHSDPPRGPALCSATALSVEPFFAENGGGFILELFPQRSSL